MSERDIDDSVLQAMRQQGDQDTPEAAARRVVELFARRVGQTLSEEEIQDGIRRVLAVVKLPIRR